MARRRKDPVTDRRARFGVYLKPKTREQLLLRAIQEGRSATELVEELIEQYLAKPLKGRTTKN